MPFEIEHDWQASLATPRPRLGESAKTRLLLLLCAIWLGIGLVGHQPWRPDEAQSISIIKHLLEGGDWVVPMLAGTPSLKNPPLYYLSAAASAKLFSPWLAMHDAARLVTGLWMALALLMVGMAGREMWGKGQGRQTTFIFLGSIGLFLSAHLLAPEVAGLCGYAMAFYGLALAQRRPWRAAVLIGCGIGIAFLASGLQSTQIIVLCALLLPVLFRAWRRKSYLTSLGAGLILALPWLAIWLAALWQRSPDLARDWLFLGKHAFDDRNLGYFVVTLSWFAWPALPLAAWSLWHYRSHLLRRPQFQLGLVFLLVALLILGFGADDRDIHALPMLVPLALVGSAAIEQLWRNAASLLDWFGIMLFGTVGFLIWLGWIALMTGLPAKLAERAHKLSPAYIPEFSAAAFLIAAVMTLLWLLIVFKTNKRSNRATITDWAVGITMAWTVLMTLWLPWLDAAKSYQAVLVSMGKTLPGNYACMNSKGLGDSQRALLDYYLNIKPLAVDNTQRLDCDLYLIQEDRGHPTPAPGTQWEQLWEGKRASDRHEMFRLFHYRG